MSSDFSVNIPFIKCFYIVETSISRDASTCLARCDRAWHGSVIVECFMMQFFPSTRKSLNKSVISAD